MGRYCSDRLLGGVGEEQAARPGADEPVGRVVPGGRVLLAVPVDEHAVVLAGLQRVGADYRVAVLGRQVDGELRRRRAVPDAERARERARQRGRVLQPGPVPARPRDVLAAQQEPQELVVLPQVLVLLGDVQAEQRVLQVLVALADHDLQAATAELVDRREVLREPDRVVQGQHRDARGEQDAGRAGGDRAQQHGRGRRQHRARVPLPHREGVEPELLGEHRRVHRPAQPVGGGHRLARDGVGRVEDDVEDLEAHQAAAPSTAAVPPVPPVRPRPRGRAPRRPP